MSKSNEPIRILYLDDSPIDAKLVTGVVGVAREELPATVECVLTRDAYLAALQRCDYDVILSDHRMPGYSGDDALRDARILCPDVPFIMGTATPRVLRKDASSFASKSHLAFDCGHGIAGVGSSRYCENA